MDPLLIVWLNRIGIVLNFVSFFLVAPEILGENRLIRIELRLQSLLVKVSRISPGHDALGGIAGALLTVLAAFVIVIPQLLKIDLLTALVVIFIPPIAFLILAVFWIWIGNKTIQLLKYLTNHMRIRQFLLIVGVSFFITGNLFQLLATF
jgi:hypothetical protein